MSDLLKGLVNSDDFGLFTRLKSRLGLYERFGNLFLGYCTQHKTYFLDLEHTNGDIRCPICYKAWLVEAKRKWKVWK